DVPIAVPGRLHDDQSEIADIDGCPILQLNVNRARLELVVARIEARLLGDIEAQRPLVARSERRSGDSGKVDERSTNQPPQLRSTTGMVTMAMCQDQMPDSGRIQISRPHVLDNGLGAHAGPRIDQRKLITAIDQVDVTVQPVSQVEAHCTGANQVDALGELHVTSASGSTSSVSQNMIVMAPGAAKFGTSPSAAAISGDSSALSRDGMSSKYTSETR